MSQKHRYLRSFKMTNMRFVLKPNISTNKSKMFLLFLALLFTANSTTIWVSNLAGGIFKSTDDGTAFTAQTSGVTTALRSMWAKSATDVWVVGDNGIVLTTTNGGTTWTTKNLGTTTNFESVFWVSATTGFVGGANFFAFTTNSGSTFTQTSTAGLGAKSIYFVDANNGWITIGAQIHKTSNGGANFVAQTVPSNTGLNSIAFINANTGVAVGLAGFICRTTNGGTTWTSITSPTVSTINYVKFVSATVGYAGYASGLLTTTDAGATWSVLAAAGTNSINSFAFSGTTNGWIIGGTVRRSVNSGVVWNTLTNPSPASPMFGITIDGVPTTTTTTTTGSGTPAPASYQVTQYYSGDLTCSSAFTAMQIVESTTCTPSSTCTNINNNYGQKVSCVSAPPSYPSGWAALEIWTGSASCQGTSTGILVAPADTCTGKWIYSTAQFNCSNNLILDCQASVATCGGCSSKTVTSGGSCVTGNPTTSFPILSYKFTCTSSSGTVCFHKDTMIEYESENFYVENIPEKLHDECVSPHTVKSDGVVIYSGCGTKPLRLTKDHLVFTERGLIAAENVNTKDFLIGNGKNCQVIKIEEEKNQMYYGLNCKESIVYAEGVKCSTFGKMHIFPSFWMKWMSKLVGIKTASKIGDFFANLIF